MECYAKLKTQYKKCVVCGKIFADPQSNGVKTCGPECSKKHRQQLAAQGVNDKALHKAQEAAKQSPLSGKFETNAIAKTWRIQAPDGQIYECRNLKNWLREHEDLLDGTVQQAWDGIVKIKYGMQGKRKRPATQWKGWRLLEWGD